MFPSKCLYRGPLRKIPNPNSLILSTAHNQLMFRVEDRIRHVIEMSSARIDFPRFRFAHPPDLDRPVICGGYDQRKSGVESRIVSAAIMSLENVFDRGKRIEGLECPCPRRPNGSPWTRGRQRRCRVRCVFAQARNIPHTHGLVHRGGNDEVIFRVESRGHDIVRVAG
jgi:hypothetical protein